MVIFLTNGPISSPLFLVCVHTEWDYRGVLGTNTSSPDLKGNIHTAAENFPVQFLIFSPSHWKTSSCTQNAMDPKTTYGANGTRSSKTYPPRLRHVLAVKELCADCWITVPPGSWKWSVQTELKECCDGALCAGHSFCGLKLKRCGNVLNLHSF